MKIKILTPATSANLGPGFDTLGLAIELYNEVIIENSNIHSVKIRGEGANNSFIRKKNFFISIFNEIFFELSGKKENFRFEFINKIPFSRGLGSSSAVIISAIASAYKIAGFKVDKNLVLNRALQYENHPDNIAPASFGGFTCSVVKQNKVFTQKVEISSEICAVIVIPSIVMKTSQSRSKLPKQFCIKDCVSNISHASFLSMCFANRRYDLLKTACEDLMHENLRMQSLNELFEVRKTAYENGALMSALSGSGSSFLNIVYNDDAKNLQQILARKFNTFETKIFSFQNSGYFFEKF